MGVIPPIVWPMLTESQTWAILLACIMMLADILAGFIGACVNKEVDSSKMRQGLGHKTLMLIIIAIAYILGVGLTHISGFDFEIPSTEVVCGYIIIMELTSVFENITKAWPEFSNTRLFDAFRNVGGGKDGEDE